MAITALAELGPLVGRLVATEPPLPGAAGDAHAILSGTRLELVWSLFQVGGRVRAANSLAEAAALADGPAIHALWRKAVDDAAVRLAAVIDGRLAAAATEARLPRRRRAHLGVSDAERAAMARRLAAGAGELESALRDLDAAARRARAGDGDTGPGAWSEVLAAAARRLETAWLSLEAAAARELEAWEVEAAAIRAWRRPRWPLGIISVALLAFAAYFGLVVGGYLPATGPLRPLAEWWWNRP
ncbi:MAG: hypothetical protein ACOY71_08640 [Gemmatimonadota bacterium]